MLHERDNILRVQRRQVEHTVAEAMIEKAVREPQHMIDRAGAEAALPQKVGFKAVQQFATFGLCGCQRRSCRHSYLNQMRDEQSGKVGNLDLAFRRGRQPPSQFDSQVWRQCRGRNALGVEQATEAPQ